MMKHSRGNACAGRANAIILNGARRDGETADRLASLAAETLNGEGYCICSFRLRDLRIEPCLGCFSCWDKTPGLCVIKDEMPALLRAASVSDVLVLTTPLFCGGYSYELKKAVDRLIPLSLPFFRQENGVTRHVPRYKPPSAYYVLGTQPANAQEHAAIFSDLARRNALNMHAPKHGSLIVAEGADTEAISAQIKNLISGRGTP